MPTSAEIEGDTNEKAMDSNGHACNSNEDEKRDKLKKKPLQIKAYFHRNSVLTDLMDVNHLQSVYNIHVAFCSLLLLNAVLYYFAAPHMLVKDLEIISWSASCRGLCLLILICLHAQPYLVYKGFQSWVYIRNQINKKIADYFFLVLYLCLLTMLYTVTPYCVRKYEVPPVTSFAIMCEQVRISMKIYSFVRENVPRVLRYNPEKDGNQERNLYPSLEHFTYFLFIPAFIYRDTYPQTKEIRWKVVFHYLFEFCCCIFITYCAFMRFNVDLFQTVGIQQWTLPNMALIFAGSMIVGSLFMFLIFYGLLHCWLNAFAELMMFGDRQFYQDWWNSTSFSQYYRKWNAVVYDWLYTYVYADSHNHGLDRSKSLVLVFLVSAIVHEYVISISVGFFFPVLLIVYSTIGVLVVFLTNKRTSKFWNTFMWGMLCSGWGILIFLYCLEWYARVNCQRTIESSWDYFVPRLLSNSCHIVQRS